MLMGRNFNNEIQQFNSISHSIIKHVLNCPSQFRSNRVLFNSQELLFALKWARALSPTLGRARKLCEMVLLFLTGLFLALRRTAGCCYCCKMAALTDEEALGVAITLHTDFGQYCSRPWFFSPLFLQSRWGEFRRHGTFSHASMNITRLSSDCLVRRHFFSLRLGNFGAFSHNERDQFSQSIRGFVNMSTKQSFARIWFADTPRDVVRRAIDRPVKRENDERRAIYEANPCLGCSAKYNSGN